METVRTKAAPKPMIRTRALRSRDERLVQAFQNPGAVQRELNNRSLYQFLQCFWHLVSAHPFSPNWHIEYLCSELETLAYRVAERKPREYDLIINVPPGSTKTITCSIMFPIWCWTNWFWMRFICSSYSAPLSLESAGYCRDIIQSELFRELYPELEIKDDKNTKSNFRIVKKLGDRNKRELIGGSRYSTSVGGTLTGFHGDILLVDDPLNPGQAASETEIKTANHWVEQTLSTRKTDKAVTLTVIIMQRLHQDDPSGHMLAKKKANIRHISLPGECRNYSDQVKPPELIDKYVDGLLDPKRMPWSVLKDMEADLGQYGYAGQIGQNPTPPGGGMFKVDNFSMMSSLPDRHHIISTIRWWDKAASKEKGRAWTAGVKISLLSNNKYLIEDVKKGRWTTDEREAIMRTTAEADGLGTVIWMEQEPGSSGKDSAKGSVTNLSGFKVYYEPSTGDKVDRADALSVQVNNGNVILLNGLWNHDFIEEFRFFPFGKYKDQVDAASSGFNKLSNRKIVRNLLKRRRAA
jgi:predicted phage terminase large subunit-like protein